MSKYVLKLIFKLAAFTIISLVYASACAPVGSCSQGLDTQLISSDSKVINYTVREGDTLSGIASEYQVALDELMRVNKLANSLIFPGATLALPEKNSAEGSMSRGNIPREELMLLARLIHAEARGESFEGQVAVGAVILNRLANPHFPKTITEVVFQKNNRVYQFSPVGDGSINLEPDEIAIEAALQALSGKDPTKGALFFYNPEISRDQWIKSLPVVTRIGNHVFATSL
ncbi:cell wall hydrolase [Pelotomaculum propionicicum]|uniref:Spore cortex-lytic enzyme n=1 Tax=Pelotomaculum propionicicum TaxID=258475 RepID=A0A4Y7RM33_9FIRM|nr:cell wall hydrolase [Pelotomaculum propionicicum]NLI11147.1 LysM peptidoglycan-binding domain-containing protein [Peptococcaceae bacterium]TEB09881.1 Spore cortex-lytic enzyme [Pelotomaculum propionicicum]